MLIHRDFTPNICPSNVFVGIFWPGFVAVLSWLRYGVKSPFQFSSDHIIGSHKTRSGEITFARGGTYNHQVVVNYAGHHGLHSTDGGRVAAQAFAHVHVAVIAKARDGFSGHGIDGLQGIVEGEDQALVLFVFAFPIIEPPSAHAKQIGVDPDLLATQCTYGNQGVVFAHHIHRSIDDNGAEEVGLLIPRRVHPGHLQFCNVFFGDVRSCKIPGLVRASAVMRPG